MVKKGWGFRDLGTFKSDVSHKWFNEVSTLIERFLCTESDGYPLKLPKFAILGWHCLAQAHGQPDCQILKYQVDFLLPLKLHLLLFSVLPQNTLGQSVCRIFYFYFYLLILIPGIHCNIVFFGSAICELVLNSHLEE